MAENRAADGAHKVDWEGIENSPEFQELVKRKRSFVLPATVFFLGWYMAFIALCALAADFMSERVYEGLTVGYVLALTQFLMVFVLGLLYLSRSKNVFDPLAEKAIEHHAIPDEPRAESTGAVRPADAPAEKVTR